MSGEASEPRVPILMYHKVAPMHRSSLVKGHYVSPGLFSRQMRTLKAFGYEPVSLNGLFVKGAELPKRPIVITFDDGYQNFYDNALPVLKACGFKATVFLVANQLGGFNDWDASLGDVQERLMGPETLLLAAADGIDFGSHTLDHVDLKLATAEEARRQIEDSKQKLEKVLGTSIESFCYPYGRMNSETPGYVHAAGYRLACSTQKGTNTPQTDRYALRRINVRSDTWTPILWLKLLKAARNGN